MNTPVAKVIAPGSTIGIVGGGQLGRMTATAAAELGYRVHIFTPETDAPASQVADKTVCAAYDDEAQLAAFAAEVDVITFEFENVPAASVEKLAETTPVRPSWQCLATAQDRVAEKTFADGLNIATATWRKVTSAEELAAAVKSIGTPAILKTTRLGYDGKGQVRLSADTDPAAAWADLNADEGIVEGFVNFDLEVSVITARGPDGRMASFDVVENRHKDGILDVTIAPADVSDIITARAQDLTEKMATALDLVGLLAVELFVTPEGDLLMNEMAPRPHNSGHWTQDGCTTSQFEQFVRAICGLPLGTTERHSATVMKNLIGKDADAWADLLMDGAGKLHLYGKKEARPGRKMGHVNRLYPKDSKPEA